MATLQLELNSAELDILVRHCRRFVANRHMPKRRRTYGLRTQPKPGREGDARLGDLAGDGWDRLAARTLDDLAANAPSDAIRIVEKSLANDRLLGIASRLLPGSRVLHMVRDPRDVAVSCYLGRFNLEKHPWTTSIAGVAAACRFTALHKLGVRALMHAL